MAVRYPDMKDLPEVTEADVYLDIDIEEDEEKERVDTEKKMQNQQHSTGWSAMSRDNFLTEVPISSRQSFDEPSTFALKGSYEVNKHRLNVKDNFLIEDFPIKLPFDEPNNRPLEDDIFDNLRVNPQTDDAQFPGITELDHVSAMGALDIRVSWPNVSIHCEDAFVRIPESLALHESDHGIGTKQETIFGSEEEIPLHVMQDDSIPALSYSSYSSIYSASKETLMEHTPVSKIGVARKSTVSRVPNQLDGGSYVKQRKKFHKQSSPPQANVLNISCASVLQDSLALDDPSLTCYTRNTNQKSSQNSEGQAGLETSFQETNSHLFTNQSNELTSPLRLSPSILPCVQKANLTFQRIKLTKKFSPKHSSVRKSCHKIVIQKLRHNRQDSQYAEADNTSLDLSNVTLTNPKQVQQKKTSSTVLNSSKRTSPRKSFQNQRLKNSLKETSKEQNLAKIDDFPQNQETVIGSLWKTPEKSTPTHKAGENQLKLTSEEAKILLVPLETAAHPFDCFTCLQAFHQALVCPKSFRRNSQTKPFRCNQCPTSFVQYEHLVEHSGLHKNYTTAKGKVLRSSNLQTSHKDGTHADKIIREDGSPNSEPAVQNAKPDLTCKFCKKQFLFPSKLKCHISSHYKSLHVCKFCSVGFSKANLLAKHYLSHEEDKDLKEKKSSHLETHDTLVREDLPLGTPDHSKDEGVKSSHDTDVSLSLPNKKHRVLGKCTCRVCGKKFKHSSDVKKHLKSHKIKKLLPPPAQPILPEDVLDNEEGGDALDIAADLFPSQPNQSSMGSQRGNRGSIKQTPCKKKVVKPQSKLIFKYREKNLQKAKILCRACGKSFPFQCYLKRHMVAHRRNPGSQCKICGVRFMMYHRLLQHMRNLHRSLFPDNLTDPMTGQGLLKCQTCEKFFTTRYSLRKHLLTFHMAESCQETVSRKPHRGQGPFKCIDCGAGFVHEKYLMKHTQLYHTKHLSVFKKKRNVHNSADAEIQKKRTVQASEISVTGKKGRNVSATTVSGNCPICGKQLLNRKNVPRHMRLVHAASPPRMSDTRKKIVKQDQSKQDLDSISMQFPTNGQNSPGQMSPVSQSFDCEICDRTFISSRALKFHCIALHSDKISKPIKRKGICKCEVCGKVFCHKQNREKHFRLVHLMNKFSYIKDVYQEPGKSSGIASPTVAQVRDGCFPCTPASSQDMTLQLTKKNASTKEKQKTVKMHTSSYKTSNKSQKPWRCPHCHKMYMHRKSLVNHKCAQLLEFAKDSQKIVLTQNSASFKCRLCKRLFKSKFSLYKHVRIFHPTHGVYKCQKCDLGFQYVRERNLHTCIPKQQDNHYQFQNYGTGLQITKEQIKHIQNHKTKTNLTSIKLKEESADLPLGFLLGSIQPAEHLNSFAHSSQLSQSDKIAPVAGKVTELKSSFVNCPVCQKSLAVSYLKRHLKRVHPSIKDSKCKKCSKVFKDFKQFKKHCHRNFPCTKCNFKACSQKLLIKHCVTEHGDRPFKCEFCNADFKQHISYIEHRRFHTNEKPYKCTYCNETFARHKQFVSHHRTRHKIDFQQYQCKICFTRFKALTLLGQHMQSHPEAAEKCVHCGRIYWLQIYLQMHIKRSHTPRN